MGKTCSALFCGYSQLNIAELSYICLSTVSINEFYRQLCLSFLEPLSRKADMFKAIQERVRYLLKEKKKTIMIAEMSAST